MSSAKLSGVAQATAGPSKPSLRDHLVSSLSALPNTCDLSLTVLAAAPKRTTSLFPHAVDPPRCYEREYLVTVSATSPTTTPAGQSPAQAIAPTEPVPSTSSSDPAPARQEAASTGTAPETAPAGSEPILVSAIHAYLYTLPTTSTSILYISKVDSSGYLPHPRLSVTKALIKSFSSYHLQVSRPSRIVRVHLFARSQGQYLFPNSAAVPAKRVSGGLALCGWWKGVYEDVVRQLHAGSQSQSTNGEASNGQSNGQAKHDELPAGMAVEGSVTLRYMLPSYSAAEAAGMLGAPRTDLPEGLGWIYGPPFTTSLLSESASGTANGQSAQSLAGIVPSLPDDPKTRFLDELVLDAPAAPAAPATHATSATSRQLAATRTESTLSVATSSEAGPSPRKRKDKDREHERQERRKAEIALAQVGPEEFWERLGFRQECSSGDVTGFFALESVVSPPKTEENPFATSAAGEWSSGPELKLAIVDRLHQALLNCDFQNRALAVSTTASWNKSARGIVVDELGEDGFEGCTGTVKAKTDLPVPEAGVKRKEEVVTKLQPRKKKKV